MKPIWRFNTKDTPVCNNILCFRWNQKTFRKIFSEKIKSIYFEDCFKSLDICQTRETPKFHLKSNAIIFWSFRKNAGCQPTTDLSVRTIFLCFGFLTGRKCQIFYQILNLSFWTQISSKLRA